MPDILPPLPEATLPNGEEWPAIGLGTWRLGESADFFDAEVKAVRLALEMGYRVIDTAEMYGEGACEQIVGLALRQAMREGLARDEVRLVSKFYPSHATVQGMLEACERSLKRLGVDHLDLYLLHWRGSVPLQETIQGFEVLQRRGWIRHWGVSNFDHADLLELAALPGGNACASNQVWYSLAQRGVEVAVLPWQRARQMPLMAYSPLNQGELAAHPALEEVAERYGATPAQIALAWLFKLQGVLVIPKAVHPQHLRENWRAARLRLSDADMQLLARLFPAPSRKVPLAIG
jgi:diketogulonate reductase-like aldo/keto reductase